VRDLFFLTCGSFRVPAAAVEPRRGVPSLGTEELSNTVGVAVRDDGTVVLIDAGMSRETCASPRRTLGRAQVTFTGVRTRPGDAIVDQLAALGIDRSRVRTIVATHMHFDHVGGAQDFPEAEVVCSDVELSAYRSRVDSGYRAADLEYARMRPVYLGAGPSYGFGASHDVFGDGQIVMLDAHGHTPGIVAVALRTRERCYVHVGDVAYQSWEWGLSPKGPSRLARLIAWRPDLLPMRYSNLRDCEADPRRPVIVPSHDRAVFDALPHAPALERHAAE
jgi:glyoxylase-like metal-dependent hydrolase (beta-lactamase superfamily II)